LQSGQYEISVQRRTFREVCYESEIKL
jgi:hypothetical protein